MERQPFLLFRNLNMETALKTVFLNSYELILVSALDERKNKNMEHKLHLLFLV